MKNLIFLFFMFFSSCSSMQNWDSESEMDPRRRAVIEKMDLLNTPGTEISQVRKFYGKPDQVFRSGNKTTLRYDTGYQTNPTIFEFENDELVSVNFDQERIREIKQARRAKAEAIEQAFGGGIGLGQAMKNNSLASQSPSSSAIMACGIKPIPKPGCDSACISGRWQTVCD